tara:strand:- start:508 stop:1872 length:1365 start_codon:yes stop_codon:yes gene_type:complete
MARGTGLAGGIFQGILASEQIKDKAEERKMRQGLVLSQLESAKVDREVKGLQMKELNLKLEEAEKLRQDKINFENLVKDTMFEMVDVQEMAPNGGFRTVQKPKLKSYEGSGGHRMYLQDISKIAQASLLRGDIKPQDINLFTKNIMDIANQVGQEKFKDIILNPNKPENIEAIVSQLGIQGEVSSASFGYKQGTPIFTISMVGQKDPIRYDASNFLIQAGLVDGISKLVGMQEKVANIGKIKAETTTEEKLSASIDGFGNYTRPKNVQKADKQDNNFRSKHFDYFDPNKNAGRVDKEIKNQVNQWLGLAVGATPPRTRETSAMYRDLQTSVTNWLRTTTDSIYQNTVNDFRGGSPIASSANISRRNYNPSVTETASTAKKMLKLDWRKDKDSKKVYPTTASVLNAGFERVRSEEDGSFFFIDKTNGLVIPQNSWFEAGRLWNKSSQLSQIIRVE